MLMMFDDNTVERYGPTMKKCKRTFTVVTLTISFVITAIALAVLAVELTQKTHIVYIQESDPLAVTSDKFLSIALDSSIIANDFKHFNITDPKMVKMMKALSPAYLRIGGTMADRLTFVLSNASHSKHDIIRAHDGGKCSYMTNLCSFWEKPNFTMDSLEWLALHKLAQEANLEIIFDLNALRRFDNGTWDYRNAEELIRFSSRHNLMVHWELGNEPNTYRHQFDYDVDPTQLAKDFHTLYNILLKYRKFAFSLLVGPDVTRPDPANNASENYLKNFLVDGADVIDAITWHQYYFNGATASLADFINPENFDILKWQIIAVNDIVEKDDIQDMPIWLGETSSAYGGGAPHLSNRFVASFLWLDKLGLAAKYGLEVVIRQSVFQGNYALINDRYNPTPDWWVSVLYKKLVGKSVVDCHITQSTLLRLYCHCSKEEIENSSSVTVFGVNLDKRKARIRFEGMTSLIGTEAKNFTVHAYILTTLEKLDSRYIFLNDNLLSLTKTNDVPNLPPKIVKAHPYVMMPAYSLAFWVVPVGDLLPFC